MAKKFQVDIDLDQLAIRNALLDPVASDPGSPVAGQVWYNSTSNLLKYYDGTTVQVIASQSYVQTQIQQIGQSQGAFDASPGLLPTSSNLIDGDTTIRRGDYWDISVAGTIAGIGGADELSIGDVLKFVGTSPTNPAHWIGIQRNLNDTLLGNAKTERQTVNLVANTPLNVNAASITDIFSVQVYNSAGAEIVVDIEKLGGANQVTLTSKKSLTGVKVDLIGAS